MTKKRITDVFLEILLWLMALAVILPFLLVMINSVKDRGEAALLNLSRPSSWHWENYRRVVVEGRLLRSFLNSLSISVFSVSLSVGFSSVTAFILSRRRNRGTRILYYYFLLGLAAPLNMVTLIKVMQLMGLMNRYSGIILLFCVLLMPFSVFLYYGFMNRIPLSLDESALIDGASFMQLFGRIIFPLLKPVSLTVVMINFMNAWNDFMLPLYVLGDSRKWPMTLAVYNFFGRRGSEWNLVFADVVLTVLPVALVYAVGQPYLVSGMTAGSLKE